MTYFVNDILAKNQDNAPERKGFGVKSEDALAAAQEIIDAGGLAWIEPDIGNDMGHENTFMGWTLVYFTPERVADAFAREPEDA